MADIIEKDMSTSDDFSIAPLFITGAWRSGTTLISRILNNHHELDVTYDTVHFLRFSYNKYNPINKKQNVQNLVRDTVTRLRDRYGLKISFHDVLSDLDGDISYASVYDSIMRNFLLKKSGKKLWGEKTNLAWTKIPYFLEMFPLGRVVHIIRDPRAVLASWKKFTHAPGNDYIDSILNCYDSMLMAMEYSKRYSSSRYTCLTYEELVAKPYETVRQLCQKLGLDYEDNMLDVNNFTDRAGGQWQTNTVYNVKVDGISTAMIDKWKNELEEWEIALTDRIMGDMLDKYYYKSVGLYNRPALIEKAIKEVQKSDLASEGMVRFLLTGEGYERYPSDPLDERNWNTMFQERRI